MNKTLGYASISILSLFLFVLLGQEKFKVILQPIGLYFEKAGVFTDCSLTENEDHSYCRKKETYSDKQWKKVKEKPGFNLTGG